MFNSLFEKKVTSYFSFLHMPMYVDAWGRESDLFLAAGLLLYLFGQISHYSDKVARVFLTLWLFR